MRRRIYSGNPNGGHEVRFFDGLSVDPYAVNYVADGGTATLPPPPNPDPDYLIFSSWNNPSTNITSNQDIVATYNTVEGYTYAFLKVTKLTGKTLDMHFLTKSGTITIDWGDGIEETADADETVTDGYKKKHDYEDYGEYVVKIIYSGESTFTLGYNDMQHFFVGTVDMTKESFSKDMAMLTKLYVGSYTGSAAPMIMFYANLKYIVLPNDFTTVGDYFMAMCFSLKVAPSLNSVTTVGDGFMGNCYSLEVAPSLNSVTTVGDGFMGNCYSLEVAPSLNSVTTVGDNFMSYCYSLKVAPSLNSVTTVGSSFMYGCSSLEVAPSLNSVTTVGDNFMSYCYSLKVAPSLNSVTTVGSSFMYGCSSLKVAPSLNSVTTVGSSFMYGCSSLEVAPSLNSVTTVGDGFMGECYSLKSLTINQYITSLNNFFLYNSNVTMKIICEGSTPPTLMSTSIQTLNGCFAIYVPDTAVDTYKGATNWSYYADYIYPMSDMDK